MGSKLGSNQSHLLLAFEVSHSAGYHLLPIAQPRHGAQPGAQLVSSPLLLLLLLLAPPLPPPLLLLLLLLAPPPPPPQPSPSW